MHSLAVTAQAACTKFERNQLSTYLKKMPKTWKVWEILDCRVVLRNHCLFQENMLFFCVGKRKMDTCRACTTLLTYILNDKQFCNKSATNRGCLLAACLKGHVSDCSLVTLPICSCGALLERMENWSRWLLWTCDVLQENRTPWS